MKAQKKISSQRVVKGAPSGFVISLLVHAAAFMLAGLLVVFNVVTKEEKKFIPPKPVERPKMKLKKPKVKVKKNAKPKSSNRIVTKVTKANMPDIQLPELSGVGEGFGGGGFTGFEIIPDLSEVTIFGGGQSVGNDFIGTLYDFKRTRRGSPTGLDNVGFLQELAKFTKTDWKPSRLTKYYQAPKKLYTTHFMIPTVSSDIAPTAFGEPDMIGYAWAVYYKGEIVHPEGGRFRFWAQGDDVIIVRVNGEVVVDGSVSDAGIGSFREILTDYVNVTADSMKYYMGHRRAEVGKWITLEPGVPQKMEVVIGESPGGSFAAMLAIEEEGVEYPKNPQGGPYLPMFRTAVPGMDVLDSIFEYLVPGEACPTNGPVFCDYPVSPSADRNVTLRMRPPDPPDEEPRVDPTSTRLWTLADGASFEGGFVTLMGKTAVIKSTKGKTVKLPLDQLSVDDRTFLELAFPPEFSIDFRALSGQRHISSRTGVSDVPTVLQWNFGAKCKQLGTGDYNRELTLEYFAIGQQLIDRNKYILLDRSKDSFVPTKENGRSHEFINERMLELIRYINADQAQGRKKSGYLITLTDERGEIIQHQASSPWLWDYYYRLKELPVGAFMDKTCTRVFPSGPKPWKY